VVFDTGMAEIAPAESGKLRAAMVEIEKIRAKYGAHATVKLYVGGYTDRVGSSEANLALSARRAEAIGAWFRSAGFAAPIYHQGFGERGQAVHTPDEVDEPRNRRAAYIVAAEPPPLSDQLPARDWAPLR
jgi:outer membrane protein OmpA-like peptidoglycan-associated protein